VRVFKRFHVLLGAFFPGFSLDLVGRFTATQERHRAHRKRGRPSRSSLRFFRALLVAAVKDEGDDHPANQQGDRRRSVSAQVFDHF